MRRIEMFLPTQPVGQMRPRAVRFGPHAKVYKDSKQQKREDVYTALMLPHAPETPFGGPLRLLVVSEVEPPKSWPKWKRAAALAGKIRPTVKPDVSNILKHIEDVMQTMFMRDDVQVVDARSTKKYTTKTGVRVILEEIGPEIYDRKMWEHESAGSTRKETATRTRAREEGNGS